MNKENWHHTKIKRPIKTPRRLSPSPQRRGSNVSQNKPQGKWSSCLGKLNKRLDHRLYYRQLCLDESERV